MLPGEITGSSFIAHFKDREKIQRGIEDPLCSEEVGAFEICLSVGFTASWGDFKQSDQILCAV